MRLFRGEGRGVARAQAADAVHEVACLPGFAYLGALVLAQGLGPALRLAAQADLEIALCHRLPHLPQLVWPKQRRIAPPSREAVEEVLRAPHLDQLSRLLFCKQRGVAGVFIGKAVAEIR